MGHESALKRTWVLLALLTDLIGGIRCSTIRVLRRQCLVGTALGRLLESHGLGWEFLAPRLSPPYSGFVQKVLVLFGNPYGSLPISLQNGWSPKREKTGA